MSRRLSVTFRGLMSDVVVDRYDDDEATNSCEVEWHFDGLTTDDHTDLHVSAEEDEAIVNQIHKAMAEGDDD